ncbi:UDP-N-acetylmuramate:L-alanyl-gamma-D-glutamyl-meso-diaminopimelate ligase [Ectothiorhodospira shaposhnikovii]|uniref:UDP-N-acetylmuramate:L-alanyl-gamma-D-glutamyl- meso-diaminopimelate ligase n=1 Tax=Ectothiorhodospira shaposhnikovii TaxID=1054 RepID=UPI001EE8838F|nr:UDP-N-acetylmuramate:L-alanyl-gamma-D-glutamyl-meso-diaminopimelate ligase [Ectothiorhodospira shaposhnikovii]MCG5514049.1 UDP-N-acetylmuramate:L-alanyl-gamma-D-glutamyl-meso-diaminopimelate ligase [Ectothiorhodospira shaposhnikovii]
MSHVHILGICGTFMAGVALLARSAGYRVTGSDQQVYPPMSTLLAAQGIPVSEGYDPAHLDPVPDVVVVGNVMTRGNPAVEYVLNRGIPYASGPQWLAEHVLKDRWVLAVAGTHGKTTTASLLAWILEDAGLSPGFLIGGVPDNFQVSARLGETPFFVVEADEYDTAFFDKRSKFVHYHPRTLILNNLEYDHADIFPDLAAIERQFHHLVRTVPGEGRILCQGHDAALSRVLAMGCWTPVECFGTDGGMDWRGEALSPDGSHFRLHHRDLPVGEAHWSMPGHHNMSNAVAALAAARHVGVPVEAGVSALSRFAGVKRRLQVRGTAGGVTVHDDFAHHPTAIAATLAALRGRVGEARILAVLEPRSNTMRMGVHRQTLANSLAGADQVFLFAPPDLGWDVATVTGELAGRGESAPTLDGLLARLVASARPGDHVLIMSNGGFGGLHDRLLEALAGQ